MQKHRRSKATIFVFLTLILSGCVMTSKHDIIKNDQATLMFGGQKNLLWIGHDGQQILLERMLGESDRTYIAQSVEDPSDATPVRFLEWPEFSLLPDEKAYIATAELTEGKDKEKIWYYQLLTNNLVKNIWTSWSFDPPDGKHIEIKNLDELKSALNTMVENKHFKRRELIVFRAASDMSPQNMTTKE